MKKEIADRLVEALESGKYKQGRGLLKFKEDGEEYCHCVMGVLCELAVKDGILQESVVSENVMGKIFKVHGFGDMNGTADPKTASIPDALRDWAGIYDSATLISYNDRGYSFEYLAKYIKEHWELF